MGYGEAIVAERMRLIRLNLQNKALHIFSAFQFFFSWAFQSCIDGILAAVARLRYLELFAFLSGRHILYVLYSVGSQKGECV